MYIHWKSKISIKQEIPTPLLRCNQYGMRIQAERMGHNIQAASYNRTMEMWLKRKDVEIDQRSGEMEFSLCGREGGMVM